MMKFVMNIVGMLLSLKNLVFADSNLIVIKRDDPRDNYRADNYDTFKFLSRVTTNAQYFSGPNRYCPIQCMEAQNSNYLPPFFGLPANLLLQNQCITDCSRFQNTSFIYSILASDNQVPQDQKCLGRARNCITYEERSSNTELYRWSIAFSRIKAIFGTQSGYDEIKEINEKKPWCPVCRCYCDNSENPKVTTSVCLDIVSSNIKEDYVVTGVRFRIVDQVLRLQIRQGKLTDDNIIDPETVDWQMINNCKSMKNMSFDYRALQMDDMILPEEYFITGFSFRNNDKLGRFVLSIFGKRFVDLKNININATEYWRPSDNRVDLMTPDMTIPLTVHKKNTELSTPDKNYITFQLPNFPLDIEDNYNELIPFLDIRDVVSDLKPLRGAGIYWRGQKGHGGYVAFKLFVEDNK